MPPASEPTLGTTLRGLREARGLGIRELARLAGVSKRSVQDWETDRYVPLGKPLDRALRALEAPERLRSRLLAQAAPGYARLVLSETTLGPPVDVGQVLRAMRLRQGTTQAEVARAAGVRQGTLARWESGDSNPSAEALHTALFALGASPEEALAMMAVRRSALVEGDLLDARRRFERAVSAPLALRDVLLLEMESALWWQATRDPAAEGPLGEVLALRASHHLMTGAVDEIDGLVRRANRLGRSTGDATPAASAVFAASWVRQRLPGGAHAAARTLERWSERVESPRIRQWLRSSQGLALARANEPEVAIRLVEEVERDTRDEPWGGDFFREDLVEVLVLANRPERATEVHATRPVGGSPLVVRLHVALGEEPPAEALAAMRAEPIRNWPHGRHIADIERGLEAVRRGGRARFR